MSGSTTPIERAHAKVNLHLHVVGRRDDGYHLLDSLAVFAAAHDVLRVDPDPGPGMDTDAGSGIGLRLSGPFGAVLDGEAVGANLVSRAAAALLREVPELEPPPGLALVLEKRLPVASGIGGGSADAAAALRLLRRICGIAIGDDVLERVAARLGADVPVCVRQCPAVMGGIGGDLFPAPVLPVCGLLLVNPGIAVSTPAVFRARSPGFRQKAALPARWANAAAMADTLRGLGNDLQDAAIALCPPVAAVLDALGAQPDCLLARMSGSGATCFGLFPDVARAEAAAARLRRDGWWCDAGAPVASGPSSGGANACHPGTPRV